MLKPKAANSGPPNERKAITTVGRGTYSIRSSRYRFTRYFDGTEELYDLEADPNEWTNRAGDAQLSSVQQELVAALPADEDVAHYVRYGEWKAVLFRDRRQPTLLFQLSPGTGSGGGIGETRSVADQHPEVIELIEQYLLEHPSSPKHLVIPES